MADSGFGRARFSVFAEPDRFLGLDEEEEVPNKVSLLKLLPFDMV